MHVRNGLKDVAPWKRFRVDLEPEKRGGESTSAELGKNFTEPLRIYSDRSRLGAEASRGHVPLVRKDPNRGWQRAHESSRRFHQLDAG